MIDKPMSASINQTPFRFCPSCASSGGDFIDAKEYRCPHCGFRFFQNVAAACGLFLVRSHGKGHKELLLVQRAHDPSRGLWGLPGGFIDPGETMEGALYREVSEEIGLGPADFSAPRYLGSWPNTYDFAGVRYYSSDSYFVAELLPGALEPHLADMELSDWQWRAPELIQVTALAFPSLRQAFLRFQPANS